MTLSALITWTEEVAADGGEPTGRLYPGSKVTADIEDDDGVCVGWDAADVDPEDPPTDTDGLRRIVEQLFDATRCDPIDMEWWHTSPVGWRPSGAYMRVPVERRPA